MAIKFNDPSFQKICETVVERHGGDVNLLIAKGINISPMNKETYEKFQPILREMEAKVAAWKDMLALCDMAERFGYKLIEEA